MPEVPLPWGGDTLTVALPDHWTLTQVAEPSLRDAPADWADRLAVAISQPASGPPLAKMLLARPSARVVLVVEDDTRHSPLPEILEVVMREIHHAGIPDEHVQIAIATGMHVAMTPEKVREKIGPLADSLSWRCNAWDNPAAQTPVGRCQGVGVSIDSAVAGADLRILVSSVSPHLQAGFGGGYKMLIPGVASLDTIRAMHRRGLGRGFRQLVGVEAEKNAMRSFIDEAGRAVDAHHGDSFAVHYVLDGEDRPTYIAAGQVLPSQRMLAKQCAVSCGVLVPQAADVLITNAHPRDLDLWQCFKSIPNTLWAVRPNGVIICMARCPAGTHGMDLPKFAPRASLIRRVLRWIGPAGLGRLLTWARPSLAGDAAFFIHFAMRALHRNPILMVSPALHEAGVRFPGMEIFASADQAVAAADALLGGGPQKVVAFPSGGVTYPVPPTADRTGAAT